MARRAREGSAILEAIGGTPLVEIHCLGLKPSRVRVFAKYEACNPGGSIKDRPVRRMMEKARAEGLLQGGRRLLDSSSGNAGIAYAMLGAVLGIPVTLVVPGNASRERLSRIRRHGAELILTDPLEGYDHAVGEARRLAGAYPERYWYCNQYENEENWRAHYEGTGVEILEQIEPRLGGPPDAFVCGIGTGGTLTGVGRRLREVHPGVAIAVVAPDDFPGIEGLKPLGGPGDFVPGILDDSLIDTRIRVTIEDATEACRSLAREGLFVGPSSGANLVVARVLAARGGIRSIATVLSDLGERYVSTGMW